MASEELNLGLGLVAEESDDRIQCLAMEYGVSREELLSMVLGVGLTVMEVSLHMPEARVWVWDGQGGGRRIELPHKSGD